jgi:hypothetical protein
MPGVLIHVRLLLLHADAEKGAVAWEEEETELAGEEDLIESFLPGLLLPGDLLLQLQVQL